jgi:hypothetical protein
MATAILALRIMTPPVGGVGEYNIKLAAKYATHNAGKVERIATVNPVRCFSDSLAINKGEDELRRMLDITTEELLSNGKIESIISAYEKTSGEFLRVAAPYQTIAEK